MNDNKRIILNTGVIYVKLILSTVLGLFTSRIILQVLGADDYGLYSVVGGVVTFLNIIGITMISVSNRYIAVEIGKGEDGNPNRVFNIVLTIHLFLAFVLILIGGIVGTFYVNNYLNVMPEKISDALFVLYASLFTTAVSVIAVPYNGLIIAREKFAFVTVVELASLLIRFGLVILLLYADGNKLRLYALIMAFISILTRVAYQVYCHIHDREIIRWKFNRRTDEYKSVFGFTGWSLFGAVAYIGKEQGAAMIINYFFGTVLNAAFGLATQVNRHAMMFTKGLCQAAIPQIMKSYGSGNTNRSLNLVYTISRISTMIMLVISIPLLFCMDEILVLWLGTPPEYTTIFSIFMLINAIVSMLGAGFDACIQSTGNIKKNEIYSSIIYLSMLPIIFIMYKAGLPPYMNVVLMPILTLAIKIMQVFIMRDLTSFSIKDFFDRSLSLSLKVILLSTIPLAFIRMLISNSSLYTLLYFVFCFIWTLTCVAIYGVKKPERDLLMSFLLSKIKK